MLLHSYICSTIIPERLDPFINKYAEYTHDKWAFEKVERPHTGTASFFWIILYKKRVF